MAIPQATAYETDVEVLRIRVNYLREQVERLQSIDLDLQMAIQQRDELLAVARELRQSVVEMAHAKRNPSWFTDGRDGAERHFFMWAQKGADAAKIFDAIAKVQK